MVATTSPLLPPHHPPRRYCRHVWPSSIQQRAASGARRQLEPASPREESVRNHLTNHLHLSGETWERALAAALSPPPHWIQWNDRVFKKRSPPLVKGGGLQCAVSAPRSGAELLATGGQKKPDTLRWRWLSVVAAGPCTRARRRGSRAAGGRGVQVWRSVRAIEGRGAFPRVSSRHTLSLQLQVVSCLLCDSRGRRCSSRRPRASWLPLMDSVGCMSANLLIRPCIKAPERGGTRAHTDTQS